MQLLHDPKSILTPDPCEPASTHIQRGHALLPEAVPPGGPDLHIYGPLRQSREIHLEGNTLKQRGDRNLEMPGLYEKLVAVAAVVCVAVVGASPVVGPEPIRCAPCLQESVSGCPAVPDDCKQVLREPGCSCCMACALEKGASCGVHTAHCGEGLRCTPRPDEARPLHALTRGQGVCTEDPGQGSVHPV